LQVGLETKLLESRDGTIRPVFDVSTVEVPRDYVPTTAILAMPTPVEEDLFLRVVDAIAAKTGMDRKAVIRRVNEVQEKMDVEVEVAAMIAARQAGVDVAPFLPAVKARLQMPRLRAVVLFLEKVPHRDPTRGRGLLDRDRLGSLLEFDPELPLDLAHQFVAVA